MGFYCSYGAQSRTIQGIKPTLLPWQRLYQLQISPYSFLFLP